MDPAVVVFAALLDDETAWPLDSGAMTGAAHVDGRTWLRFGPGQVQIRSAEGRPWHSDGEPPWDPPAE